MIICKLFCGIQYAVDAGTCTESLSPQDLLNIFAPANIVCVLDDEAREGQLRPCPPSPAATVLYEAK